MSKTKPLSIFWEESKNEDQFWEKDKRYIPDKMNVIHEGYLQFAKDFSIFGKAKNYFVLLPECLVCFKDETKSEVLRYSLSATFAAISPIKSKDKKEDLGFLIENTTGNCRLFVNDEVDYIIWKRAFSRVGILRYPIDEDYIFKGTLHESDKCQIFLAEKTFDQRLYAIKGEQKSRLDKKAARAMREEIEIRRKFHHPSIVDLYEVYESEKNVYMVMEQMSGGNLCKWIFDLEDHLSLMETKKVMKALLETVHHLHQGHVVHGKITPNNVLVNIKGERHIDIKINDFREACLISRSRGANSPTRRREGEIPHPKDDVFGLGTIFYLLLVGRNYSVNENIHSLRLKKISSKARTLLYQMLAADPQERISAAEANSHPFFDEFDADVTFDVEKRSSVFTNMMKVRTDGFRLFRINKFSRPKEQIRQRVGMPGTTVLPQPAYLGPMDNFYSVYSNPSIHGVSDGMYPVSYTHLTLPTIYSV
eukprot:TRINITY_DN10559_c0_g1_i6.p1 TRINITY_DN10559_c0_g1~~TRINITY_DN10559_c0_g1_i6.p1  ORF type:complete len:478 (-),score=86.08 TRINITY_DN10559_c0_g1_i6:35-1468(-)